MRGRADEQEEEADARRSGHHGEERHGHQHVEEGPEPVGELLELLSVEMHGIGFGAGAPIPCSRAPLFAGSGAQAVEREAEDAVDLLGVRGADRGDAADHLGDVGDVDVGADGARLLRPLQQALAGAVDRVGAGAEDGRVAVDVGEQLLGEGALGRGEADELVQPAGQRLQRRLVDVLLGRVADRLDFVEVDRFEQVLAGREVAVERPDPDPGAAGDVLERRAGALLGELLAGGGDQLLVVATGVGALRPRGQSGDVVLGSRSRISPIA